MSRPIFPILADYAGKAARSPYTKVAAVCAIVLAVHLIDAYAQNGPGSTATSGAPVLPQGGGKTATNFLDEAWKYFYNDLRYRIAAFALVPSIAGLLSRDPSNRIKLFLTAAAIGLVAVIPNILGLIKEWAG